MSEILHGVLNMPVNVWDSFSEIDKMQRHARYVEASEKIYELEDKLQKIKNWCMAYPLDIFPEPEDWVEIRLVLKEHTGTTLDAISASNMRHVLEGIQKIINE